MDENYNYETAHKQYPKEMEFLLHGDIILPAIFKVSAYSIVDAAERALGHRTGIMEGQVIELLPPDEYSHFQWDDRTDNVEVIDPDEWKEIVDDIQNGSEEPG